MPYRTVFAIAGVNEGWGQLQRPQKAVGHLHCYTDKIENKIFLIYEEIQMRSGAKSYMRKGFLIYEEMYKFFTIYVYEEAVSHI